MTNPPTRAPWTPATHFPVAMSLRVLAGPSNDGPVFIPKASRIARLSRMMCQPQKGESHDAMLSLHACLDELQNLLIRRRPRFATANKTSRPEKDVSGQPRRLRSGVTAGRVPAPIRLNPSVEGRA